MVKEMLRWEEINSAHALLVRRPVCFCRNRGECRISSCCSKDSKKFVPPPGFPYSLTTQASLPPRHPLPSPPNHCCLRFGCLHSPRLQSSYTQRVGGSTGLCLLMFVFPQSGLYSHVFQCHLEDSPVLGML